jgi:hypothetical protein
MTTTAQSANWGQVPQHQLNAIICKDLSKTELAQHLHGRCGSPVVAARKKATQNDDFVTWPGIDTLSIDARLPKSVDSDI